jgi:preprotein translocase subunit SecY
MAFPQLEELSKEGEYGRERINQYTRFLTVPLAALQAYATYALLHSQGIVKALDIFSLSLFILILTTGTVFLMWLGELLGEYGLGNGISMIILAGIVAGLPPALSQSFVTLTEENFFTYLAILGGGITLTAVVVVINEAIRPVPVQYARRVRGGVSFQTPPTFLPLRLNHAGMIPILFAVSLIILPTLFARYFSASSSALGQELGKRLLYLLDPSHFFYNLFYFFLVAIFTYFYTAVTFNPEKVAGEIKKSGGFIPGVRPGRPTAQYLGWILVRLTLVGAVFLGGIAVIPSLLSGTTDLLTLTLGGSGLLIVVSVVLDTLRQVESHLLTRDYEGFLR